MKRRMGIAIIVLVVVVPVAVIALILDDYHQTQQLLAFRKKDCARRLTDIGEALRRFARKNDGHFPEKFGDFCRSNVLDMPSPICPGANHKFNADMSADEFFAALDDPSHPANSYIYLGSGRSIEDPAGTVIMLERLENHEDGINVLYKDGTVKWLTADAATTLLATIRPTTRATTVPATMPAGIRS